VCKQHLPNYGVFYEDRWFHRLQAGVRDEIEIDEIQYAIGIVTSDTTYVYRLFNHECDEPGLLKLEKDGSLILEAKLELDSSKLIMGVKSPYPVTQFIN
jgi:hypothetical protein